MANNKTTGKISAQPRLHQRAAEIQAYGTVNHLLPLELEEPVRLGPRLSVPLLSATCCARTNFRCGL